MQDSPTSRIIHPSAHTRNACTHNPCAAYLLDHDMVCPSIPHMHGVQFCNQSAIRRAKLSLNCKQFLRAQNTCSEELDLADTIKCHINQEWPWSPCRMFAVKIHSLHPLTRSVNRKTNNTICMMHIHVFQCTASSRYKLSVKYSTSSGTHTQSPS